MVKIFLRVLAYTSFLLLLAVTYWCARAVEFSWAALWKGLPDMVDFVSRMWPPDLSILSQVWSETVLTIQLAWIATLIAAVISLPVAFLAAKNIFPNRAVRALVLFFLNADRAIDALILALFFVSALGLGPFPGTMALAVHSAGMLGKLFTDAIETVDQGPIEAVESAGGGRLAVIRWAVLPQVAPHFISHFLFRFELNVRAAVVLGLVGAGGIGFLLTQYMRLFLYQRVATVVLVILVLVMAVDFASAKLRKSVL